MYYGILLKDISQTYTSLSYLCYLTISGVHHYMDDLLSLIFLFVFCILIYIFCSNPTSIKHIYTQKPQYTVVKRMYYIMKSNTLLTEQSRVQYYKMERIQVVEKSKTYCKDRFFNWPNSFCEDLRESTLYQLVLYEFNCAFQYGLAGNPKGNAPNTRLVGEAHKNTHGTARTADERTAKIADALDPSPSTRHVKCLTAAVSMLSIFHIV